jgi:hypothetical protein
MPLPSQVAVPLHVPPRVWAAAFCGTRNRLHTISARPRSVLVRSLELQPLGAFLGRLADDFPNINAVETTRRLAGADLPFPHRLIGCGRF